VLLSAVRAGGWALHIGMPESPEAHDMLALAQGITGFEHGLDWVNTAFWQRVACADVFALPLMPGLQRATGDQSLLTAMALGAITVCTDSITSRLYIEHGVNGFLVAPGDARAWHSTLKHVLGLPQDEKSRIRARARDDAQRVHSEERRLVTTLERAAAVARHWRALGRNSPRRRSLARASVWALVLVSVLMGSVALG
jgi:hypothetical protein